MGRSFFTLLAFTAVHLSAVHAQSLRAELERIHDLDQLDRQNVHGYVSGSAQQDSVVQHMALQDSLDLLRVRAIIDSAGWLGADAIGDKANQALWLVLQHADAQPKVQEDYLPLLREAVEEGKAQRHHLAMLEDRVAVNNGRPQEYGSQMGYRNGKPFIQPLIDETTVNERRKAMGLEPLEDYAARFGINWSPPEKKERVLLLGPLTH